MESEEVSGVLKRELLSLDPDWLRWSRGFGRVGGVWLEAENDVIDRDSEVETTLVVEGEHFVDGVRGFVLANVGERPAVAERRQPWAFERVESKEPSYAQSEETVALSERVP